MKNQTKSKWKNLIKITSIRQEDIMQVEITKKPLLFWENCFKMTKKKQKILTKKKTFQNKIFLYIIYWENVT